MSRRVATMALTAVLLVALLSLAWMLPVPYVAMSPGPTKDVLGKAGKKEIIQIDGYQTHDTSGKLDLTTVSATPANQQLDLMAALQAWADPEVAVVPRNYLYPEDQTPEEVDQFNAELMDASQQDAIAAALRMAGKPVEDVVVVMAILEGAPALDKLKAGDVIESVDGQRISSPAQVSRLVSEEHEPGDRVRFSVLRDGRPADFTITTEPSTEEPGKAAVGISVGIGYEYDGEIKVNLPDVIGGPSAGAMFALGIYDKLSGENLTADRHIAGTGTIDAAGNVGPIGGIQQKVAGARAVGASVFMVPAANCADAADLEVDGIRLVRVKTLEGAVRALEDLRRGNASDVPTCDATS